MDYKEPQAKRLKKADKAKRTFEKNGKYSQKAVRQAEELKRVLVPNPELKQLTTNKNKKR